MNPFLFQKKKHHWKLLSSKFVYPSVNTLPQINQLTNALLCSSKELAVNAAIMASLFGQKPTFAKSKISRSQAFRLQQVSVTASNSGALTKALSSLSRSILPFQQENSLREINVPKDKRISWALKNCNCSTQLDPLIFTYLSKEINFNLVCSLSYTAGTLSEILFLLRLAQMPLSLKPKR